MSSKDIKDPSTLVEEGLPVEEDVKSEAGSSTTAPSVESGNSEELAAPKTSRRRWTVAGVGGILVVAGIITAAVLVTNCNKNKNQPKTTSVTQQAEESISLGGDDEAPPLFTPETIEFAKPFGNIELPLFGEDVLETYTSREALEADLTLAAKDVINTVILQNLQYSRQDASKAEEAALGEVAVLAGVGASMASGTQKQTAQAKVRKSMTNNQEKDVDEADYLKTDGNYVYAAYGDYLVVWDLEGNMVAQDKMPTPQLEEQDTPQGDDQFFDPFFDDVLSYAYIETIQLTENHVLVVVGGLGEYTDDAVGYGSKGTQLRVYNKPTADQPVLTHVATRDIHGYFFHSRYLEATNSVHIVTGGDFNTYNSLIEPLDVYNFAGLNDKEYYQTAVQLAQDELIPKFVTRVADFFVQGNNGQLPSMLKVNTWMTQAQRAAKTDDQVHPEDHYYGSYDEAFRAYMQVTSIQADSLPTTTLDGPLSVTTTALLGPSSWSGFLYATADNMVLHLSKYHFDLETNHSEETLFVMHLKVTPNGVPEFHSVAALPGYLPNQQSLDIQGDDLRLATTNQKWFPLENVWPVCGDSWYFEDECMTEAVWNDCFDVALNCRQVVKTGCPYTFECAEDDGSSESSTDNFVWVLDISQSGEMTQRGSVPIGEPHEIIMGVHFGETFSYANTFDQRDPFYVLKLEPGQAPEIAGEVKLDGFSTYIQPLNDNGSLLVGIGQNVSGMGMDQAPSGLLVTVFDVADPAQPKVVASDMLVNSTEHDSFSDAEFDAKAVQYSDGFLVIPISLYANSEPTWRGHDDDVSEAGMDDETVIDMLAEDTPAPMEIHFEEANSNNFEGFIVLDLSNVATDGIQEVTRINHARKAGESCHYCSGYLSYRRSFLFEDKSLMTVHDSVVVNTDLTTGNPLWTLNVTMPGEDMSCCY